MNLTASQTGMRLGEVQALRIENIKKDHLIVKHSWDRVNILKSTKTGKERIVPIKDALYYELIDFYKTNSCDGPYIFSINKGVSPIKSCKCL